MTLKKSGSFERTPKGCPCKGVSRWCWSNGYWRGSCKPFECKFWTNGSWWFKPGDTVKVEVCGVPMFSDALCPSSSLVITNQKTGW